MVAFCSSRLPQKSDYYDLQYSSLAPVFSAEKKVSLERSPTPHPLSGLPDPEEDWLAAPYGPADSNDNPHTL